MSYCKINIAGKERGLKFNQLAIMIMQEYISADHLAATASYALIYAGLRANAYVKREEVDFTFEDVCEWVESVSMEDMEKVNAAFQETEAYKRGKQFQEEQEASKKKEEQITT